MKRILLFVIIINLLPFGAKAQKWRKNRKEIFLGVGTTTFLGDLGGGTGNGRRFFLDKDFAATRGCAFGGMRYRLDARQYVKGALYYGIVSGNDKYTTNIYRRNRNLSFRSPIIELSAQYEFVFWKAIEGRHYSVRRVRTFKQFIKQLHPDMYLFLGVGGFFFNPKGPLPGTNEWVALQPLGTEGQGIKSGTKKYSRFGLCIPYGLGMTFHYSKLGSIGLEFTMRKTFTDYIDDVSGNYYSKQEINDAYGPKAALMSDPSVAYPESHPGWTDPGQKRGGYKSKDSYGFMLISYTHKLATKKTRAKF